LQNAEELATALKSKVPTKIDIGPVYTQDPEKRIAYKGDTGASGFKPVEREFVIDIDLTDYDDVRNSASGTSMSSKCWSLLHVAIKVCVWTNLNAVSCTSLLSACFSAAAGIIKPHTVMVEVQTGSASDVCIFQWKHKRNHSSISLAFLCRMCTFGPGQLSTAESSQML
jgi:hypothetical protein